MAKEKTVATEDHGHDKVFVVTFLAVLAVLVGIAVVIGILANTIDGEYELSNIQAEKISERLEPVGAVYTDASQVPAKPKAAASVVRTPEQIVQSVCAACHDAGVMNAPKTGDAAAWKPRLAAAGGIDGLLKSAIAGIGTMPARGGDADITDDQLRAAIELLMK